ncbi:MAG: carbohydrate-binding protein [Lachnotalea sp.]
MEMLTLIVKNKIGKIKKEVTQVEAVNLVFEEKYRDGDAIIFRTNKLNTYYVIQIDDAMRESIVYITKNEFVYTIPFGEKKVSYSPNSFQGDRHLISARIATESEINLYRNLAENVIDQHGDHGCFPHASANVETRGEAVFAARNAIDGITENHSHGEWPYQSWGINMQEDAEITLLFGRIVEIDEMELFLRADFPHDNWWEKVTFTFSDGSIISMNLTKTDRAQQLCFPKKEIEWVKLGNLIKADDPSLFPALSQWKVFGVAKY